MRVTIAAPSTFWTQKIAEAVESYGGTASVYTTSSGEYEDILPPERIYKLLLPGMVKRFGYTLPIEPLSGLTRWNSPIVRLGDYLFDRGVARRLQDGNADLFHGFAGAALRSIRRANETGATTVVERSSTHIRTQQRLLQEEYDRFGAGRQPISRAHVKREEAEYDAADYVVTPSEFTATTLVDNGVPQEKIRVIPFGTDVPLEPPDRKTVDGPTTFLFAGAVSLRKGIQYLLPAWEQAALKGAELIIAGRVDDAVSNFVDQYRSDDSIHLAGWVDDMDALYRAADVFVLPSIEEGSARVTYEAMAWGLPIVTTGHSGWVGTDWENGIEVPIRDINALAECMKNLSTNSELRKKLSDSSKDIIRSGYSWDAYSQRLIKTYQDICGE